MSKKILFVFNPQSGKGLAKNKLYEIVNDFTSQKYMVTVHPTQERSDGYKTIVKNGADYDIVVIGGGDGTLNECVSGVLDIPKENQPVIGYIPMGSANDFASSLEISKNPKTAVNDIINGRDFLCDVGIFKDKYFMYIAAFGAFTDVAYDTPQQFKNYIGHAAYIIEGIKRIPYIKSYYMEIEYDGIKIGGNFVYGMISNSTFVAGVKSYQNQKVELNDGLFECVLIKYPENPLELQSILTGLLKHEFSSNNFHIFKASSISIKSEQEINWTLDGEDGGCHKSVAITNLHEGVKIIVPDKK